MTWRDGWIRGAASAGINCEQKLLGAKFIRSSLPLMVRYEGIRTQDVLYGMLYKPIPQTVQWFYNQHLSILFRRRDVGTTRDPAFTMCAGGYRKHGWSYACSQEAGWSKLQESMGILRVPRGFPKGVKAVQRPRTSKRE